MSAKILIVDDDAELREALVDQLTLQDEFCAIAVESGARCLQAAKVGEVDLVIMDVGLSASSGQRHAGTAIWSRSSATPPPSRLASGSRHLGNG
jgi:DNA-binding response OmpR family regulator